MKSNILPFFAEKRAGVPQPTARFDGKIIIITGANSGLGYEAALKFVGLGAAKVILGVRSMSKGALACRQIEEQTQQNGIVDAWELDMDRYSSIQQFAARASAELQRIDVAILNAAVAPKEYSVGHEGWQSTLQVNVLGTALLALLLLPKLRLSKTSTNTSHLIIVTSEAHRWVEHTDIPDTKPYGGSILQALSARPADGATWNGLNQLAISKLLAMYVAQSVATLATQPSGEIDVIVSTVCPGACKSELARDFKDGYVAAAGVRVYEAIFSKPTEEGARVYVSAAALGVEGHRGWYKITALTTPGELVTSDEGIVMQKNVWSDIVEELRVKAPAKWVSLKESYKGVEFLALEEVAAVSSGSSCPSNMSQKYDTLPMAMALKYDIGPRQFLFRQTSSFSPATSNIPLTKPPSYIPMAPTTEEPAATATTSFH
ncbi:hypothetical protein V490_01807, partial [Pseudogymnoascus sp. VKM F-3557]